MGYFVINLTLLSICTLTHNIHIEPTVLVHGGADNTYDWIIEGRKVGIKKAAILGYKILKKGGTVVDAVEEAVKIMEDDENFNAGHGSALNNEGEVEMDACIMVGSNLSSGGVSVIKNVAHPVSVARLIMEKSPHFLLVGEGARHFAKEQGVPFVPSSNLISAQSKQDLADYLKINKKKYVDFGVGCGGVGAVAVDSNGHVAAASSSGGLRAKHPGRASDASIIGAGLYADDEVGAVVVTGHGEAIARYVLAHDIISAMKRGFDPGVATRNSVKGITERFRKPTGAITISKQGQIGISFTTEKMAWAYQIQEDVHHGVDDYDHFSERIKL